MEGLLRADRVAGQERDTLRVNLLEASQCGRDLHLHFGRDGVALVRPVEADQRDRTMMVELDQCNLTLRRSAAPASR